MSRPTREIVRARHSLASDIAEAFLPLEISAHETAARAAKCVATVLDGHSAAALAPIDGEEIIDLLTDAARLAALSRAKVMRAHALFVVTAEDLGIPFYADPACPPNERVSASALKAVA